MLRIHHQSIDPTLVRRGWVAEPDLSISSERSRRNCDVADNSNKNRNSALCFTARVQEKSEFPSVDDVNAHVLTVLLETTPTKTATRHSASLLVYELVLCVVCEDTLCHFARTAVPQRRSENVLVRTTPTSHCSVEPISWKHVDYVNQGVAGFSLGAPNRIDAVVLDSGAEVSVGRVVNALGVSFCKRAGFDRASACWTQREPSRFNDETAAETEN